MKWKPGDIAGLFLDNADYEGILFWYEAIVEINKPPKNTK